MSDEDPKEGARAMGDDEQGRGTAPPTREEVENLRQLWNLMMPAVVAKYDFGWPMTGELKVDPTLAVDDNVREAAWRSYQDAARRHADWMREREVDAHTELARTNTRLATVQAWLAAAVAIATVVQAATATMTVVAATKGTAPPAMAPIPPATATPGASDPDQGRP